MDCEAKVFARVKDTDYETKVFNEIMKKFMENENKTDESPEVVPYEMEKPSRVKIFGNEGLTFLGCEFSDREAIEDELLSDIVNVEQPNDRTVFVQFADGKKEVAVCSEGDVFNFETGVLICVFKKFLAEYFGDAYGGVSGSSLYNKLIKYAVSKKDATKKKREEEKKQQKLIKAIEQKERQKMREWEKEERQNRIREISEAVGIALKDWLPVEFEDPKEEPTEDQNVYVEKTWN